MDSLSATSLFSALNFIIIFVSSVSTDQTNITAEPGHDASLPCRSPDNKPVIVVEWIRPDLGSEYVLLYRDDQLDLENQHPSFKDRVDLQDRWMKDGNVSLALRNVTTDDRGAYECQVIQTNSPRKTVGIINLDVKTSSGDAGGGNRDGSVDLIGVSVGVSVVLVVLLVVVILVYLNREKASCWSPKSDPPPVEPPEAQQPLTDQNQPDEQRIQSDPQDDGSRTSADQLSSRITD